MKQHWRNLMAVAGALAVVSGTAGCSASRPRNPVTVGAGTLDATRKALEGEWSLVSLEVVDARGARRTIPTATGRLIYDAFGNMDIRAVVEDPALTSTLVLNFNGRIVIDTVKREFRPAALETDRPVDPSQIVAVSPDKIRRYELTANTFVVTYLDAASAPTAVASWRRASAPGAATDR